LLLSRVHPESNVLASLWNPADKRLIMGVIAEIRRATSESRGEIASTRRLWCRT
jgi:hypothetical protein